MAPWLRNFSSTPGGSPHRRHNPAEGPLVSRRFSVVSLTHCGSWFTPGLQSSSSLVLLDPESGVRPRRHQPAAGNLAQTKPDTEVFGGSWLVAYLVAPP